MIDFIGDIHGHADKLTALLDKLGYEKFNESFRHSERKVLFVGDYIDRGPQIKETLGIVRRMVENESAIALMGNHEYNAICFHYPEKEGGHLRKHEIKNILQHYQTLLQFQNLQDEYAEYLDWFMTLPLFYETEKFRAVHACWDQRNMQYLQGKLVNNRLTEQLVYESVKKGTEMNDAIEVTLKGKETLLPAGHDFTDKDGTIRHEIRVKWWDNPANATYKSISVESLENLPDVPVETSDSGFGSFYDSREKPVFFGHYWLKGRPQLYRKNICCLDYSVAKGGYLAAYRWDGESELTSDKLLVV